MTWFNAVCLALILSLSSASRVSQAPDSSVSSTTTQPAEGPATGQSSTLPKAQFFGGTVTALDGAHITISRSSPGKSPEHRTFLINVKTKISKAVKVKSRVTVRYRRLPEGDVALEILLRPLTRIPRAS
jgi:hypothetical protein